MLWNVRSLVNNLKIQFILQTLRDQNIDITCITESWLDPDQGHNHSLAIIKSYGFQVSFTPRKNRTGGGVAVLMKKSVKYTEVKHSFMYTSFEWHGVRIVGSTCYTILCVYRKQEFSMLLFLEELSDYLLALCTDTSDELIILGDFNVHFHTGDKNSTDLADLLQLYGLSQMVNDATRISGYTLDLIFSNVFSLPLEAKARPDLSKTMSTHIKFDHYPITCSLPNTQQYSTASSQSCIKQYRNIRQIDSSAFDNFLENKLASKPATLTESFPLQLDFYNDCLSSTLDEFAPLKTKSFIPSTEKLPEWMDLEYRNERSKRRRLEKLWKSHRTDESHTAYVEQRDYCVYLANAKMKSFYSGMIASTDNQNNLFKTVSKLWNKGKVKTLPENTGTDQDLANNFNNYFCDKITTIRDSFDDHCDHSELQFSTSSSSSLDSFDPATLDELRKIVAETDIKTSPDDPLPAPLIKKSMDTLLPHILELVNLSLKHGDISGLKESVITPILKKLGLDKDKHGNYRPVVNLQFLGKLIEKVVLKRLTSHMTANNLHCQHQFGYKKQHSTETMLLQVVDEVLIGFEQKSATVLILLDMSSAFDTVDIEKLLSMLENKMKIKGTALKWFRSFLVGRTQKVIINGQLSDVILTLYGVPQGSVLGPVLFNIYVDSLPSFINQFGFSSSVYADDTNARLKFALKFQFYNISVKVPDLIDRVKQWMSQYFLKLNPKKTELLLFCPPAYKREHKLQGVFINGSCLRFSGSARLLGVQFDTYLTFDEHINQIVSECWYHLRNIRKIKRYLTSQEAQKLIHAMISSKLDYCNALLYGIKCSNIAKLQSIQNQAARIICNIPAGVSVADSIFYDLHWLKVRERIVFKYLLLVHKFFIGSAPSYFTDLLLVKDSSDRSLYIKFMDTASGRRSFTYAAPRLWNRLPAATRKEENSEHFKKLIKTALFRNTNNIMQAVNLYNV